MIVSTIPTSRTGEAAYRFCNSACVSRNLNKFDCTMTFVDETAEKCILYNVNLKTVDSDIKTKQIDEGAGLKQFMLIRV